MQRKFSKNAQLVDLVDVVTGQVVQTNTPEHYEPNDGVPVAPAVQLPRRTLRERVEDLLYRGGGRLPDLLHDDSPDDDFEVEGFEDNGPMQPAEVAYVLDEFRRTPPQAPTAPQPAPAANPPPEGQNAPAPSAAPAPSPSAPTPSPGTPGLAPRT